MLGVIIVIAGKYHRVGVFEFTLSPNVREKMISRLGIKPENFLEL